MISQVIRDSERRPELFHWFGGIEAGALDEALARKGVVLPPGLRELYVLTGGGEMFESEVVLRAVSSADDDESADAVTGGHHVRGMSRELWLFHEGSWLSAVDRSGQIVTMNHDYSVTGAFDDLEDWYVAVRKEFARRYGLL